MYGFFLQAEDGIRDAQGSRGLGDVYKRQGQHHMTTSADLRFERIAWSDVDWDASARYADFGLCPLYTSDAADDLRCVDLGGRGIIKKKKKYNQQCINSHLHIPHSQ